MHSGDEIAFALLAAKAYKLRNGAMNARDKRKTLKWECEKN